MIKILVVDDHDLVRMGIARMLGDVDHFEVIGEASCGEEAISLCVSLSPTVVLMDGKMPGISGVEATRKLLEINSSLKVIAVTACEDNISAQSFLKAGAVGYVTKGAGFDEMITAIKAVNRGELYMSNQVARRLALKSFEPGGGEILSLLNELSERELQTAIMISNGKKAPYIADIFCVSSKTVNTYRYRIFEKLNIETDVELALLIYKHGMLDAEVD